MTRLVGTTVRRRFKAAAIGCAVLLLGLAAATPAAHASFIVNISEIGSDVVATGSGSLNLDGLGGPANTSSGSAIWPDGGLVVIGPLGFPTLDAYDIFGPDFGPGGFEPADSGSGDNVGVIGLFSVLVVPLGYSSGDPLAGSATWESETFASLGLTPGVYTFTIPNDTFTVVISAVPMPATLLLLVSAVASVGAARAWRRRR
jgi:hypothetical protein